MRLLVILGALFLLPGCSWLMGEEGYFRDRSDDYRKARAAEKLRVPPHLDGEALQPIYVIPPVTEKVLPAGEFKVPRPTPLVGRESEELVRIQRLGDEQWMLVGEAPGQLWPQVRAFLSFNNLPIARVDARAGILETGWLQPRDGGMQQRYRFRIEQGVQRNTAELHVRQMYLAGDTDSFPATSADSEKEAEMLRLVAQYIANNTEAAPVSMMAQQAISATGKVSMQEFDSGQPYIRLALPYHRAWASVELALRDSSFDVRDLDRSAGVFYIRYVIDDEDGGWFDWIFGDDEEDAVKALAEQDYRLDLQRDGEDVVNITLAREDGLAVPVEQAQTLLALIKGNIN